VEFDRRPTAAAAAATAAKALVDAVVGCIDAFASAGAAGWPTYVRGDLHLSTVTNLSARVRNQVADFDD